LKQYLAMERIRSFVAIELPDELKQEFGRLQARLKAVGPLPVKWVDPYSIHLTLKFLGDVDTSRIGDIVKAIEEAARGINPFPLEVGNPGVFPSVRRTQVAWLGLQGDTDSLARLQQGIEVSLSRLGFSRETRPFTPHLTLARLRDRASPDERQRFGEAFVQANITAVCLIKVDSIHLMKSQLTRNGAIYSRLGTVPLNKP